ncbi:UPF0183-domain-containing protein [Athelia psychrophila]|uniref:UPF0183-domain-containing protein n=1 Tax=Athelia psychrophila TaxID=1759441 RepID=A0A166VQG4_9AGAM|nr:UPF0183-domain-containing protein [Fibularhizoctonia sp. CBS 109695]
MLSSDLDIRPGSGIGIFDLGASLWNVLDTIRRLPHQYPQVDIKYDPDTSCTTPIILHLRPHIDLLFSGYHQRLHTIALRKLRDPSPPLTLRYKDAILSSPEDVLVRLGVNRTFGPTYPGDDLRYPGVSFTFDEESLKGVAAHPEDRTQEVKQIVVCQKSENGQERDALEEVSECLVMYGDVARAVVKVNEGVTFHLYPSSTPPINIRLGYTTAQDLNVDFGPPLRVHYKEDDRMTIHSTSRASEESNEGDYFYNYFQHGVDFLISGSTHIVRKVILHTNVPGSPLFQLYKRCPWEIEGAPEDEEDDTPPRMRFEDRFEIISHFLSPREPPPSMLLDRTDEEDGVTLPSSKTRLHGYDGIILEVTESSQVVSVTLFD